MAFGSRDKMRDLTLVLASIDVIPIIETLVIEPQLEMAIEFTQAINSYTDRTGPSEKRDIRIP